MFDKVLNSVKEAVEEIELELSLDYEDCITKAVVHDKVWEKLPTDLKEKYKDRLFHHPYAPEDTIMFVRSPKHYEPPKLVYGEFLPPCPSDWYVMKRKNGVYAIKYEPLVGFGIFRKRSTAWGRDIKPEDVPERIKGLLGDVEEEWYSLSFEDSKWIKDFFDDQLRDLLKREFEVEDRPVR